MIEERIENIIAELTKLLIKQDLKDKESSQKEVICLTKVEAIKRSIKLLKMVRV